MRCRRRLPAEVVLHNVADVGVYGWKNFDIRRRDGEAVRVIARRAVRLLAPGHFIVEDSLHGLHVSAREPRVRET